MKTRSLLLAFLTPFVLQAQYYFNDIISTLETNRQMQTYTANKVKMVTATGFDANGVKATDFSEVQEVRDNGRTLKVSNRTGSSFNAVYNRFDEQHRLTSVSDTTETVQSVSNYQYDEAGRIFRITNTVRDIANDFNQAEVHHWIYRADGSPSAMWRIINGSDSLEIRFFPDEEGNTGDEKTFRKGLETAAVYYYYDDKRRLSDIVRYNTKFKRLMPDLMFEYDENDRIIQKITTTSSRSVGYLIWRYIFDEKGLKTKEALFNDEKQLTGKIEYAYHFFP